MGRLPADENEVATLNFRSDHASDPDSERDAISRPDLKLIDTQDELDAVRAQLDGAQVEIRTLRSQFQSSAVVREALDLEKSRAMRAEGALHTERDRTAEALAAVTDAQQKAAAALAELAAERQDVAALRAALHDATSAANAGIRLTAGQTWDGTAQRAVSEAIAEVSDWRIALKEIVRVLGSHGGWDAVVAWCPEERRPSFCCVAMWTGHDPSLRALETQTWQARREPAAAEFGAARTRPGATCLATLDGAEDRLLQDAAAAGVGSVVYVPIRVDNEAIGVIELWSRRSAEPDADVVLFLEAIGLQLSSHAGLINAAAAPRWRVGRY